MKNLFNKLCLVSTIAFLFFACKKDDPGLLLKNGTFFTSGSVGLSATPSTPLVLDSTSGGSKTAVTLNWPAVDFGASVAVTYTLQIDSINDNFVKPTTYSMASGLTKTFTMGDFNTLAQNLGLTPGTAGQIKARVKADVNQSNGVATSVPTVYSNTLTITVTPYSTIPKPIYPVPAGLYLVGDATAGGWNNPVPVPTQVFTQIDANTFGIVAQLTGGGQFLVLPVNGDWSHKYAITGAGNPAGGAFVPDANNNMVGPTTTGLYKIVMDFVKGTYTITPAVAGAIPTALFLVGDATAGGWNNPVPVPSQQFTRISSGEYKITIALSSAGSYLWLPVNGDWTHKYGGSSKTGGAVLFDSAVPGSNTPAPSANGTYTIDVNFFSNLYTVK